MPTWQHMARKLEPTLSKLRSKLPCTHQLGAHVLEEGRHVLALQLEAAVQALQQAGGRGREAGKRAELSGQGKCTGVHSAWSLRCTSRIAECQCFYAMCANPHLRPILKPTVACMKAGSMSCGGSSGTCTSI